MSAELEFILAAVISGVLVVQTFDNDILSVKNVKRPGALGFSQLRKNSGIALTCVSSGNFWSLTPLKIISS